MIEDVLNNASARNARLVNRLNHRRAVLNKVKTKLYRVNSTQETLGNNVENDIRNSAKLTRDITGGTGLGLLGVGSVYLDYKLRHPDSKKKKQELTNANNKGN